jgi:phage terminase small subunit
MADIKLIENDIIEKLEAIGIYRKEFERTIRAYAITISDYEKALKEYEQSGDSMVLKPEGYLSKKADINPYYTVLERVRKLMLEYESALGLTPAALKKVSEESLKKPQKKGGINAAMEAVKKSNAVD